MDVESFRKLVEENRIRTRNARKDAGAEAWKGVGTVTKGLPATTFLGYETLKAKAEVLSVIADGARSEFAEEDKDATLVLSETPFYAESGGQVGDTGLIKTETATFEVVSTTKTADGVFLHHGRVIEGDSVSVGQSVQAEVNTFRRAAITQSHSAAHLLQAALRTVLGSHVEQAGQLVDERVTRFDFVHFSAMTREELGAVEALVNEQILAAQPVQTMEVPMDEAKKMGAMALFSEKYGDIVRVVKMGNFSIELCGGTHVQNTGNVGPFHIISESSVAAGVRRIEAVTGINAFNYFHDVLGLLNETAATLKCGNFRELPAKAAALTAELKAKDKEIEKLSGVIANAKTESMLENAAAIGDCKLVTAFLEDTNVDELRRMCDLVKSKGENFIGVIAGIQKSKGSGNICVCCGKAAIARGAHAGNIARAVAQKAGGSGGGKPDSAMAGAKDTAALPEALKAANEIISAMLN